MTFQHDIPTLGHSDCICQDRIATLFNPIVLGKEAHRQCSSLSFTVRVPDSISFHLWKRLSSASLLFSIPLMPTFRYAHCYQSYGRPHLPAFISASTTTRFNCTVESSAAKQSTYGAANMLRHVLIAEDQSASAYH